MRHGAGLENAYGVMQERIKAKGEGKAKLDSHSHMDL